MHSIKNYSQLTICVQAANLSDCRIELNRKNRFGNVNRIEIFLARIGMLYRFLFILETDFGVKFFFFHEFVKKMLRLILFSNSSLANCKTKNI